jgi:AcrR family transcriptional regulator
MASSPPSRGERLRRVDYFAAAFELLAEGGASALTTTNVCERLGVTTGSLYHHFESGPAFYAAVVDHWENVLSPEVRDQADQAGDAVDRLQALHQIALMGNHDVEKAIRAWASSDPMVAAAQQRVDDARERHLTDAYVAAGIPADRARTLARIGLTILIGNQQLGLRFDRARLADALDEYRVWIGSVMLAEMSTAPR